MQATSSEKTKVMQIRSAVFDVANCKGLQNRQVVLNDIPYDLDLDRMIGVPQHTAEIDHFLPIDGRFTFLDVVR
jgi:hypothetical protein